MFLKIHLRKVPKEKMYIEYDDAETVAKTITCGIV